MRYNIFKLDLRIYLKFKDFSRLKLIIRMVERELTDNVFSFGALFPLQEIEVKNVLFALRSLWKLTRQLLTSHSYSKGRGVAQPLNPFTITPRYFLLEHLVLQVGPLIGKFQSFCDQSLQPEDSLPMVPVNWCSRHDCQLQVTLKITRTTIIKNIYQKVLVWCGGKQ